MENKQNKNNISLYESLVAPSASTSTETNVSLCTLDSDGFLIDESEYLGPPPSKTIKFIDESETVFKKYKVTVE